MGAVANGAAQWWSGDGGFDGVKMATLRATGLSCISVALATRTGHSTLWWTLIPAVCLFKRFFTWAGLRFLDLPHAFACWLPGATHGLPVTPRRVLEAGSGLPRSFSLLHIANGDDGRDSRWGSVSVVGRQPTS